MRAWDVTWGPATGDLRHRKPLRDDRQWRHRRPRISGDDFRRRQVFARLSARRRRRRDGRAHPGAGLAAPGHPARLRPGRLARGWNDWVGRSAVEGDLRSAVWDRQAEDRSGRAWGERFASAVGRSRVRRDRPAHSIDRHEEGHRHRLGHRADRLGRHLHLQCHRRADRHRLARPVQLPDRTAHGFAPLHGEGRRPFDVTRSTRSTGSSPTCTRATKASGRCGAGSSCVETS